MLGIESALVVLTGAFLPLCGFWCCLPSGVIVGGFDVGGMHKTQAVAYVREGILNDLKGKQLRICADEDVFCYAYPELGFAENAREVIHSVKKEGHYPLQVTYYLNGQEEVVRRICAYVNVQKCEPEAVFHAVGKPFTYTQGNDGKSADKARLLQDITHSLQNVERNLNGGNGFDSERALNTEWDFAPVTVHLLEDKRKLTVENLRENTKLLAEFRTEYDETNARRGNNIKRACVLINGTCLGAGKEFSFNGTVGERTAENGFMPAKVIVKGRYEEGVGGGVCQVSTTLYNTALLAGLTITEYHPHSLAVGYVPPSRDAMVSWGACDMKFINRTGRTCYIRMNATKGVITCRIYGKSDGVSYEISSVVTGKISPLPEEKDGVLYTTEKDGLTSESYLIQKGKAGETTKLLRKDKYLPVRKQTPITGEYVPPTAGQTLPQDNQQAPLSGN
jgi:hypothetical protein